LLVQAKIFRPHWLGPQFTVGLPIRRNDNVAKMAVKAPKAESSDNRAPPLLLRSLSKRRTSV
jgi:hypothetical protein